MTVDQIFISGTRYSSFVLHQDSTWRSVQKLGSARHGTYTASVDGKQGLITIDATGWWFTDLGVRTKPRLADLPDEKSVAASVHALDLKARADHLAGLLSEWLGIDDWSDECVAPASLVMRTRIAVTECRPVSPAKASTAAEVCDAS